MTDTMTFTGELTIVTCWCGIKHAVPSSLRRYQLRQRDDGNDYFIYCPLGHTHQPSGESTADRLRKQVVERDAALVRARQSHDQTKASLRETEMARRAEKGAKTRIKNRIANGVCPACNRSFKDLHSHMACKHPHFTKAD